MRSQIISKIGNPDISPTVIISHIRRRGEIGGSAKKVGKRIKVGNPNYEKNSQLKTQFQLASDFGMDAGHPAWQT